MKRTMILLAVPLALLVGGHAPGAWACSCVGGLSQADYEKMADVVFVGVADDASDRGGSGGVTTGFTVERVRKGDIGKTVHVSAPADEAGCGVTFRTGNRYRVYATDDGGELHTNLCAGNEDLGPAGGGSEPSSPDEPLMVEPDPAGNEPGGAPDRGNEPGGPDEPVSSDDDGATTQDVEPIALPVGAEAGDTDAGSGRSAATVAGLLVLAAALGGWFWRARLTRGRATR